MRSRCPWSKRGINDSVFDQPDDSGNNCGTAMADYGVPHRISASLM